MTRVLSLVLVVLVSGCTVSYIVDDESDVAETAASATMPPPPAERPRNVILFIADGFGPASATLGRGLKGAPLSFDPYLVGSVETSATDNRVTDSAASATAYACGEKSYNGAIGMLPDGSSCKTVLEAAEARGMATGLVATSRITHATPASFAAHVPQRSQEPEIAAQMAASGVDLLMGGGRPMITDREDGRDLTAELAERGYTIVMDRQGFEQIDESTPLVALFADSHLDYEIDRDEAEQLSLPEMTRAAIQLLSTSSDGQANGFFLMVEGSRIDHAAHGNDLIGHAYDILAFDAAVAEALSFARRDGSTLVVSTADHETGGMTLGRDGEYRWDPAPILRATASFEAIGDRVMAGEDIVAVMREGTGVEDLDEGVAVALRGAVAAQNMDAVRELYDGLVSKPAGIGWTTGGHTAVDVGLYAFGPGSEHFARMMTNDAVGRALFDAMGLER
ncbi:MAG: alkaline phosphatase [Rubricoccaceae bacterium]